MPDAPSPDELAAKASFIFRGTVLRVNASTLREVSDTSNTAIVRVDQTVQAPKVLSHYTGQEITVYLPDLAEAKVGDQAVFFTNSWLFGNDGVAVRSLGHHPPAAANAALGNQRDRSSVAIMAQFRRLDHAAAAQNFSIAFSIAEI